jgi:hypothetical protein
MTVEIDSDPDHGKTQIRLERICGDFQIHSESIVYSNVNESCVRARANRQMPRRRLHEFLDEVVGLPAIREIRQLHPDSGLHQ